MRINHPIFSILVQNFLLYTEQSIPHLTQISSDFDIVLPYKCFPSKFGPWLDITSYISIAHLRI